MTKFEYLGPGNEAIFFPYRIDLHKKGQVIETDNQTMIEELEKNSSFKCLDKTEKKTKKEKGEK